MRRPLLFASLLLLCSCATAQVTEQVPGAAPASSASSVSRSYEQVPAQLDIDYFAHMQLVGSGLTLKQIEKNDAYTRYAADYWSNGLKISGIMNIPAGTGPFPLVMLDHGYINPAVYTCGRGLKREQDLLARQKFAVFHSDYRGHADSDPSPDTRKVYDAGLEYGMDVINAIHAIRAAKLPSVDATRTGMLGHSMGGGVAMNIAVAYPDLVQALVLYAPVNTDAWENYWRWHGMRDKDDRTAEVMRTREENPEPWDRLSSKSFLDRLSAPVLLFQGDRDKDVPKEWSDALAADLRSRGKQVTFVDYAGEGHEFIAQWPDFMKKTTEFFDANLR
ncbi:MAG: alpha/beta fold hydrolase [Candidatus Peribacteraceae bacterium]|nr:alpha/beta fold hydrolase [Candidatus Peribacteraceae bacterium]MDD5075371.1 alpha/beta fold hydrolase [Candidatus Peribacteraceae bacterium]